MTTQTTPKPLTAEAFRQFMIQWNLMMDEAVDTSSATVEEKDGILVWTFTYPDGYFQEVHYIPSAHYVVNVLFKPERRKVDNASHGTPEMFLADTEIGII